jgi:chromosome segregation ATPase
MKTLIAVLTVVVALLAVALWKRNASARTSLETANAALAAVSNQLAEASMKVTHQEQLATVAKAALDERARVLAAMSNTVATLHSHLDKARVEAVAARASARDCDARVAAAEAQSAALTGRLEELTTQIRGLKIEVEQTRTNAAQFESERLALANEAECLKIEKSELARQWHDSRALRLQLQRLKARAQPLELHPDSSVRLSATQQPLFNDPTGQPGR